MNLPDASPPRVSSMPPSLGITRPQSRVNPLDRGSHCARDRGEVGHHGSLWMRPWSGGELGLNPYSVLTHCELGAISQPVQASVGSPVKWAF